MIVPCQLLISLYYAWLLLCLKPSNLFAFHYFPQIFDILISAGLATHRLQLSSQNKVLPQEAFLCFAGQVRAVMECGGWWGCFADNSYHSGPSAEQDGARVLMGTCKGNQADWFCQHHCLPGKGHFDTFFHKIIAILKKKVPIKAIAF